MTIEDIKRLNYIKYTAYRPLVHDTPSIFRCFIRYFIYLFIICIKPKKGERRLNNILFIAPTINNKKSIQTILDHLPQDKYVVWDDFSRELPYTRIYLKSLLHICLFVKFYFLSSKQDRELVRFFFMDYITACSTYQVMEDLLINNRELRLIVFPNDHILVNRCLIEIAEKHQIKTLYVQHASVTESFPPLRFDYAFLDGLESFEKYKRIGNMRGQCYLSGSPRFDAFFLYKGGNKKYKVGIALNELDSVDKVLELCLFIKNCYTDKIIVRPHPGNYKTSFDENIFKNIGIDISDPRKDLSFVFLSNIQFMIANESGIHLDAALMGVPSLLFNFSDNELMDWYSYLKKGLIKACSSYDDVVNILESNYQLPETVVRYYAASFHSIMDGKVGEMIAIFIKKCIYESELSARNYIDSLMYKHGEYAEYRNNITNA